MNTHQGTPLLHVQITKVQGHFIFLKRMDKRFLITYLNWFLLSAIVYSEHELEEIVDRMVADTDHPANDIFKVMRLLCAWITERVSSDVSCQW